MIDAAVEDFLRAALEEDLGDRGDLTSQSTIAPDAVASGSLVARQAGCIGGLDAALRVFTLVDPTVEVTAVARDGSMVQPGDDLATLVGSARSLLAAERLALNLLGQLSGVATATRALVDAVAGTNATVVDTRKTVPGMRALQKAAVRAGGGGNHRMGLYDAVLIKDNHVALAGGVAEAVDRVRKRAGHMVKIQVEVDTLEQLDTLIPLGVDAVMLDNMDHATMRQAVNKVAGRMLVEASGGITPETVAAVAATGVNLISSGALTHSVKALDIGLDIDIG